MTVTDTTPSTTKPLTSVVSKAQPVQEASKYTNIVVYGEPGVGKTIFSSKAPRPLLLDIECGSRSLLNHPELVSVPVITTTEISDVENLIWELRKSNVEDYSTVIIDNLTELQKRMLDDQLRKAHKLDSKRDPYLPYQQDYLINSERMRRIIMAYRDLPCNTVFVCHEIEDKDSNGVLLKRPALTPKLVSTLLGMVDVVAHLSVGNEVAKGKSDELTRYMQVHPTTRIMAKTRIGNLDTIIPNPDISILLNSN